MVFGRRSRSILTGMKIIRTFVVAIIALYVLFVIANTYIYSEKQSEGSFLRGEASIQWGF